jgi:uncharacterized protein
MLNIYVDADASPIKDEVYKVAARYKLNVFVVANQAMKVPLDPSVKLVVVRGHLDAADDWIVEHAEKDDIVTTADILLADRCLKKEARVIGHKGFEFDEDNIGDAVATRELLSNLRQGGESTGGPKPLSPRDKSQFLQTLDQVIQSIKSKK